MGQKWRTEGGNSDREDDGQKLTWASVEVVCVFSNPRWRRGAPPTVWRPGWSGTFTVRHHGSPGGSRVEIHQPGGLHAVELFTRSGYF